MSRAEQNKCDQLSYLNGKRLSKMQQVSHLSDFFGKFKATRATTCVWVCSTGNGLNGAFTEQRLCEGGTGALAGSKNSSIYCSNSDCKRFPLTVVANIGTGNL
jgi:hypothetical protein